MIYANFFRITMFHFKHISVEVLLRRTLEENAYCPILCEPYSRQNPPRVLCADGHSVCDDAYKKIKRESKPLCPFCRKPCFDEPPVNRALLDTIEPLCTTSSVPASFELSDSQRQKLMQIEAYIGNDQPETSRAVLETMPERHPDIDFCRAHLAYMDGNLEGALRALGVYRSGSLAELRCRQFRLELLDKMTIVDVQDWDRLREDLDKHPIPKDPIDLYKLAYLTIMTRCFIVKHTKSGLAFSDERWKSLLPALGQMPVDYVQRLAGAIGDFLADNTGLTSSLCGVLRLLGGQRS